MESGKPLPSWRQLQRRCLPSLMVVGGAFGLLALLAIAAGGEVEGLLVLGIATMTVWLVYQGRRWPRWIVSALTTVLGLMALGYSVMELSNDGAGQGSLLQVGASLLLLLIGAVLYASENLRELAEVRSNHGTPLTWEQVAIADGRGRPRLAAEADPARRQRLGRICGNLVVGSGLVAWLLFVVAVGWLWIVGRGYAVFGLQEAAAAENSVVALIWILVSLLTIGLVGLGMILAYLSAFLIPFLVTLPISLPLALRWKQPLKFLVLRPFNRRGVSASLRRVLREEVIALGHCYTLADANIRISALQRIPLLYGQLTFLTFRQRKIVAPRHLAALVRAMQRRVLRNLNWAVSRDKLFPVATVDAGWQACVTRLLAECDAVVMDLTDISINMQWELHLLRDAAVIHRVAFLVDERQVQQARQALEATLGTGVEQPQLMVYSGSGLWQAGELRQKLLAVLAEGPAGQNPDGEGGAPAAVL
ncbi:hypothetical protein [Pseudomaricurvus sp. HS19]|uniref:hypothetical protein n=1 Tax=Pseudomaricurvus sp. HS19 TaxID=2692626 RepID=UPI00136E5CC3|nr:hypothetical protein [Pseudomaricurvus sp. HS19]MYM62808.1 hypothetical protein [Pseudomaricurvus sp. HS19]